MKLSIAIASTFALAATFSLSCGAASNSAPATTPAAPPAAEAAAPKTPAPGGVTPYTTDELTKTVNLLMRTARNFANGEKVYKSVGCSLCHHFGEGADGIGPDLSGVGGRFGNREILESIIEPNVNISEQYANRLLTLTDGTTVTGHVDILSAEEVSVLEAPTLNPATLAYSWTGGRPRTVKSALIDSDEKSEVSPMPPGLINSRTPEEIADLLAYLRSGGDPNSTFFKARPAATPESPAAAKK